LPMAIPHLRVDCDVLTPHATSLQSEIIGLAQLGEKMGSPDGYVQRKQGLVCANEAHFIARQR